MQTPQRISVETFVAEEARFLAKSCIEYPDKHMNCARCGTRIKWEVAFISTHRKAEPCIGTGKISQVEIPYCPQCEEIPYARGCFHDGEDVAAHWRVDCQGQHSSFAAQNAK